MLGQRYRSHLGIKGKRVKVPYAPRHCDGFMLCYIPLPFLVGRLQSLPQSGDLPIS